jgi:hypothetical protein
MEMISALAAAAGLAKLRHSAADRATINLPSRVGLRIVADSICKSLLRSINCVAAAKE